MKCDRIIIDSFTRKGAQSSVQFPVGLLTFPCESRSFCSFLSLILWRLFRVLLYNLFPSPIIFVVPRSAGRSTERYSTFWMGLHAPDWGQSFQNWSDLALTLMNLKPHKRLYFQRGLHALSLSQSTL